MTTFNSGDYVRTSKGKLGVIESPERWIIDSYGVIMFTSAYEHEVDDCIKFYSNNTVKSKIPNQVRLGNKTFPIWSDKLTKLEQLSIMTGQFSKSKHVVTLPVEDAKILMKIYTRNKIWFQIV